MSLKYILPEGYELESTQDCESNTDDVLLIDNNSNRIIVLNVTCAYILNEFKQEKTMEEVIEEALSKFDGDRENIEKDIHEIITTLVEQNILCEV